MFRRRSKPGQVSVVVYTSDAICANTLTVRIHPDVVDLMAVCRTRLVRVVDKSCDVVYTANLTGWDEDTHTAVFHLAASDR